MNLTEHFTIEELTKSKTAEKRGVDNTPTVAVVANLRKLCEDILEPVRQELGVPIIVNSGYRNPQLNRIVGGSKNSQHMTGDAADLKVTHVSNAVLFDTIRTMMKKGRIKVGQLIWEGGNDDCPAWVHVSNPREGKPNNQILYWPN